MFFWLKVEFHVHKVLDHPESYQKPPPREVGLQRLLGIYCMHQLHVCVCVHVKHWDSLWDDMDTWGEEKLNSTDADIDETKQERKWVYVPNSDDIELPDGLSMDQL